MTAIERAIGYGKTPSYEEVEDELLEIVYGDLSEGDIAILLDLIACDGRMNMTSPECALGAKSPENTLKFIARQAILKKFQ